MAEIRVTVPHHLKQDEAKKRLENSTFSDQISDLNMEWQGHSADFECTVSGSSINGTIEVSPKNVDIVVCLSFFQSLAVDEDSIREEIYNKVSSFLK